MRKSREDESRSCFREQELSFDFTSFCVNPTRLLQEPKIAPPRPRPSLSTLPLQHESITERYSTTETNPITCLPQYADILVHHKRWRSAEQCYPIKSHNWRRATVPMRQCHGSGVVRPWRQDSMGRMASVSSCGAFLINCAGLELPACAWRHGFEIGAGRGVYMRKGIDDVISKVIVVKWDYGVRDGRDVH